MFFIFFTRRIKLKTFNNVFEKNDSERSWVWFSSTTDSHNLLIYINIRMLALYSPMLMYFVVLLDIRLFQNLCWHTSIDRFYINFLYTCNDCNYSLEPFDTLMATLNFLHILLINLSLPRYKELYFFWIKVILPHELLARLFST